MCPAQESLTYEIAIHIRNKLDMIRIEEMPEIINIPNVINDEVEEICQNLPK